MTVPHHFRIVFRGIFAGSPEEWSFSTKYSNTVQGGPDLDVDALDEDDMTTALTALLNNSHFAGGIKCTEWRAYVIGADGNMQGNPRQFLYTAGSEPQGSSGTRNPTPVSICVSSVGPNRGPARFGRFYLPGPSAVVSSDWRMNTTDTQTYLDLSTQFVKDVSTAIHVTGSADSQPLLNISSLQGGAQQTVDHLRVGRVHDTQRRRRGQLLEEYLESGHIDW